MQHESRCSNRTLVDVQAHHAVRRADEQVGLAVGSHVAHHGRCIRAYLYGAHIAQAARHGSKVATSAAARAKEAD